MYVLWHIHCLFFPYFCTTNGLDQLCRKHKNNFFDTLISFSPTFLGLALRWQDWEIYFEGLRVKPHSAENFGDKVKLCRCFQPTCKSRKSRRSKGQQRSNLTFSACFKEESEKNFFKGKRLFWRQFVDGTNPKCFIGLVPGQLWLIRFLEVRNSQPSDSTRCQLDYKIKTLKKRLSQIFVWLFFHCSGNS